MNAARFLLLYALFGVWCGLLFELKRRTFAYLNRHTYKENTP